jgi:hypothetical protein
MNDSMWDWFYAYESEAMRVGDPQRMQLPRLHRQAWYKLEMNPREGLAMYEQGKALAQTIGEPCWVLFYEYWRCEAFLFYLKELHEARIAAVQAVVEARKPEYQRCAVLPNIYRLAVDAYTLIDPVGYEDKIIELIDYIEETLHPGGGNRRLLVARRSEVAFACERMDEAIAAGQEFLRLSEEEGSVYHKAGAYAILGHYAYVSGQYDVALEHVRAGELNARLSGTRYFTPLLLAWQAAILRRQGDDLAAERYYRQATMQADGLLSRQSGAYYDALCDYLELSGMPDIALELRDRQLAALAGTGAHYDETDCRLRRCRLLGRMGLPLADDLHAARESTANLLKPAPFLAKLERVAQGDYSEPLSS